MVEAVHDNDGVHDNDAAHENDAVHEDNGAVSPCECIAPFIMKSCLLATSLMEFVSWGGLHQLRCTTYELMALIASFQCKSVQLSAQHVISSQDIVEWVPLILYAVVKEISGVPTSSCIQDYGCSACIVALIP